MSFEKDIEEVQRGWLHECVEERSDLGLWLIIANVEGLIPGASEERVRRETLAALRPLMSAGLLVAADVMSQTTFAPWEGSVDEQLTRIETEWIKLGRHPKLGEIVWFVGPDVREDGPFG